MPVASPAPRPAQTGRRTPPVSHRTAPVSHRAPAAPVARHALLTRTLAASAAIAVGGLVLAGSAQASVSPGTVPVGRPGGSVVAPVAGFHGTAGVVAPRPMGPVPVAPAPSAPVITSGLKAPVSGLVDRHHAPTAAYAPAVRSFVVNTTWASLQPVAGGPIVHPNDIDNAIALAQSQGFALKLRVRAGIDAPAWAKTLDGPPMTFYYTGATTALTGTVAGTVGRFWTPRFGAAYDDLQTKLAALYDGVPQIRETDVDRCTTIFSESYLRDAMDKRNVQTLLAAGFTRAQDDICHNEQIQAADVWKHTLSSVSFNPYVAIQSNGTVRSDLAYTESQMLYCRSVLGARCLLANHSLSTSRTTGNYGLMYAYMKSLGGPIDFQTATAAKIGDYSAVIAYAASLGASSVELPTGYTSWPLAELSSLAAKM